MPLPPPAYPTPPPLATAQSSPPGELGARLLRWLGIAAVILGPLRMLVSCLSMVSRPSYSVQTLTLIVESSLTTRLSLLVMAALTAGGILLLRRARSARIYMLIWSVAWLLLAMFILGREFSFHSPGIFQLQMYDIYMCVATAAGLSDRTMLAIACFCLLNRPEVCQMLSPRQGAFEPIVPERRDGAV
jgi:hypothetical protein